MLASEGLLLTLELPTDRGGLPNIVVSLEVDLRGQFMSSYAVLTAETCLNC